MKRLILLTFYFFGLTLFSQSGDIKELTIEEKNEELKETFDWLKSKMSNEFVLQLKDYSVCCNLNYDLKEPSKIIISNYNCETNEEISISTFNLKDIYRFSFGYTFYGGYKFIILETQQEENLIHIKKANGELFLSSSEFIPYDDLVSDAKLTKVLHYALQLAGGGKGIVND